MNPLEFHNYTFAKTERMERRFFMIVMIKHDYLLRILDQ